MDVVFVKLNRFTAVTMNVPAYAARLTVDAVAVLVHRVAGVVADGAMRTPYVPGVVWAAKVTSNRVLAVPATVVARL